MLPLLVHPKSLLKKYTFFFLLSCIKMSRKSVNFGDRKIEKSDLYKNKKVIKIDDSDVNEILASKEESYGSRNSFKYFTGYNDDFVIRPLCIKLPQMIECVRNFDGNKKLTFKISDSNLLKKYNQIWKRVEKLLKIKFVKARKKLYPQTLLEECKYEPKKIKMENLVHDDLEKSSSDELDNEADNDSNDQTESDNESNE